MSKKPEPDDKISLTLSRDHWQAIEQAWRFYELATAGPKYRDDLRGVVAQAAVGIARKLAADSGDAVTISGPWRTFQAIAETAARCCLCGTARPLMAAMAVMVPQVESQRPRERAASEVEAA